MGIVGTWAWGTNWLQLPFLGPLLLVMASKATEVRPVASFFHQGPIRQPASAGPCQLTARWDRPVWNDPGSSSPHLEGPVGLQDVLSRGCTCPSCLACVLWPANSFNFSGLSPFLPQPHSRGHLQLAPNPGLTMPHSWYPESSALPKASHSLPGFFFSITPALY